jgi:hypothetical protein
MNKNKISTAIALALMCSMAISFLALPATTAQTPSTTITHAMLTVNPNPIGIGQPALIVMWAGLALPSAAVTNDIRFRDYTLTITKPDGKQKQ